MQEKRSDLNSQGIFFQVSQSPLAVFDRSGNFIEVNEAWENLFGFTNRELKQNHFTQYLHPDDLQKSIARFNKILLKGKGRGFVNRYITKAGKYKIIEWKVDVLPECQICSVRDITQEIRAKNILVHSEKNFRTIAENSKDIIVRIDKNFHVIYVNPAGQKQMGRTLQELKGKSPFDDGLEHRELNLFVTQLNSVFLEKKTIRNVYSPQKSGLYFDWMCIPEINEKGEVIYALNILRDITDTVNRQKSIAESERVYRTLSENNTDYIARVDSELKFIYANNAVSNLVEMDLKELIGKRLPDFYNTIENTRLLGDYIKEIFISKKVTNKLIPAHIHGELRYFNYLLIPELNESGEVVSVEGIGRDISDIIRDKNIIMEKEQQLKRLLTERDKLFSVVAHDLRSPIIGVFSFTNLLLDFFEKNPNDEMIELTKNMNNTIKGTLSLLDELLNWALIQRDDNTLNKSIVSIKEQVNNIIAFYNPSISSKSLSVNNSIPEIQINTDSNLLNTILRNLFVNALKYSKINGFIEIGAQIKNNFLEFFVSDDGIGIPDYIKNELFSISKKIKRRGC